MAVVLIASYRALRIDISHAPRHDATLSFIDRNGLALGTVLPADGAHTVWVPLDRVNPAFMRAIVAAEDRRFYDHHGVDFAALGRAIRQAIQTGRTASGASTITMQVARMVYHIPSSFPGKIAQMFLAWRIEAGSDKNAILDAYINRLPMGGNLYGVEAAARSYFGVSAADLDLAQSTLLAAIPNDPVRLNPRLHWRELKRRQAYVLQRMQGTGAIGGAQAAQARSEEMHVVPPSQGILAGAHLIFALSSSVDQHVSVVRTTIDRPLQTFVEAQMRALLATLSTRNVHQGAALAIDNRTGEVLAYVGSADYFDDASRGRNDGVRALRQPGSALKPFLYELALERGVIRPNTILADVPTTYAIPNGHLYAPADYSNSYAGPVRVRVALANSLNVPAVRVLSRVGTPEFLRRLHDLGFNHLNKPADYYGLGLTLGAGEVSLWELTRAYVTLARSGCAIPLRTVASMAPAPCKQTGSSQVWSLIGNMLGDSHARARSFGASSILDLPFPSAVKTGTSSDFRDTWTVGYSSDYTVGVWVGNFNGEPMHHVSGVTGAAPLWNRIMLRLQQSKDPGPLPQPRGLVRRPICATTGARPLRDCPAVVWEYLFPSQLAAYVQPAPAKLSRTYDSWLATQGVPARAPREIRILFPRDGDLFMLNRSDDSIEVAPRQAIAFVMRAMPHVPVTWSLNGIALATTSGNTLQWPLRVGRWRLGAKTGSVQDSVTFRVVSAAHRPLRGFSF